MSKGLVQFVLIRLLICIKNGATISRGLFKWIIVWWIIMKCVELLPVRALFLIKELESIDIMNNPRLEWPSGFLEDEFCKGRFSWLICRASRMRGDKNIGMQRVLEKYIKEKMCISMLWKRRTMSTESERKERRVKWDILSWAGTKVRKRSGWEGNAGGAIALSPSPH